MKIKLKTLKQQEFQVDVEATDNIATVKAKIEKELKEYPAATQKLIFSGKVLLDTQTISDIKIKENDFMVLMAVKSKPGAKSNANAQVTATPAANAQPSSQVAAPAARRTGATVGSSGAEPVTPSPAARTLTSQTSSANAQPTQSGLEMGQSQTVTGEEYDSAIASMVAMGFQHSHCVAAMKAAYSNPDRAVEFLLSGIPKESLDMTDEKAADTSVSQQQQQSAGAAVEEQTGGARPQRASGNLFHRAEQQAGQQQAARQQGSGGLNLERLRAIGNSEQGRILRELARTNPNMLEQVLAQMAAQQPALLQDLNSNPEAFLQMLLGDDGAEVSQPEVGGGGGEAGEGGAGDTGAQYIQVTREEKDAIDKLVRLGFPRERAIQAYFACDKNEELAANYLFDNPEDVD
ncbi:putative UV excision repair protein [Coemansia reversa NRRL 1564]|uniref:UV excision repair protein RAD23 n=1 Tax=Coemansia reversa (strain ATCC 12441 / NRRL 1564) TaxID=763665 RepID=A0A2G5B910_COERN|nr:putative UV excision repair protein [Coemansia reversa NRRL 1564]|eukprot:PIA15491.1 putative UV excision repair protein [Coemansia reversa NRRL 1564]